MMLAQIALLDLIFSLDSVITGVSTADDLPVIVVAVLIADGLEFHRPEGYIYFAMAFSFTMEWLNQRGRRMRHRGAV